MSIFGLLLLGENDDSDSISLITIEGGCSIVCNSTVEATLLRTVCRSYNLGNRVYIGTHRFIIQGINAGSDGVRYLLNDGRLVDESSLSPVPESDGLAERQLARLEAIEIEDDPEPTTYTCPESEDEGTLDVASTRAYALKQLERLSEL
jgi:hypothetical protein